MILVTGGAGYIGSHAVKALLEKGERVAVIDNLKRGYKQVIEVMKEKYGKENLDFHQTDLRNSEETEKILSEIKPEAVIHFAALCLVNESMENPEEYFQNNVGGTINLLKAMTKIGVNNLVFSSTCAVYGESRYLPVDEKHPLNPLNPYGESKLLSEKVIEWMGKLKGIKYVIMRYFNVTGAAADGLIGDSKKPSQLLMQNAVRGALKIEDFKLTCPKVGTPDGTTIRDYVNVEDLIGAHLRALDYLKHGGQSDIFNLGTGRGNSTLEVVNKVKEVTGADFPLEYDEARKGEYAEIYANNGKAKETLNWIPERSLEDSVNSLIKWYKNHPNGWEY